MNGLSIDIAWERPWALVLLAIPLAILFWSRRRPAAREIATSDLATWRAASTPGAAARPHTPRRVLLALVLALAALGCAALALAGPHSSAERPQWTCVFDTSPSMSLANGTASRGEQALEMARRLAAEHDADLAIATPTPGADLFGGWPPAAHSAGVAEPAAFAEWDVPGALWITDEIPHERPRFAGFVASGGVAVPGPVGVDGADRLDWDGEHLVRRAGEAPVRRLVLEGLRSDARDEPLARVVAAWAAARGIVVVSGTRTEQEDSEVVLEIRIGGQFAPGDVVAGRDGWRATGERYGFGGIVPGIPAHLTPWLRAGDEVLVGWQPGSIDVSWIPGEPAAAAAFAVSWARLFDESVRPAHSIVPLEERVGAGAAAAVAPTSAAVGVRGSPAWILAALAAVLAFGALLARAG